MAEPGASGPVVVGFDGSPGGTDALVLAQRCAHLLGAPLVVAVVHPSPAAIGSGRVDAEWVAERRDLAERIAGDARAELDGVPDVQCRVLGSSSAAHGLHDLAEETGAALIVAGSHRSGPPERLFAGSTADRLLSGSVCPVAVAPSGMRARGAGAITRIGVAYIDTADGRAALDRAARMAAAGSAQLCLYTVVAAEAEVMPLFIGAEAEHAFASTSREAYQDALDLAVAGLPPGARTRLLTGDVVQRLSDLDADEVDLLVCGSRGYGPARRVLLGGVSARLVRNARTPVVVVPRGD
jgi:nucleotide-binding universal stress UspA family protein